MKNNGLYYYIRDNICQQLRVAKLANSMIQLKETKTGKSYYLIELVENKRSKLADTGYKLQNQHLSVFAGQSNSDEHLSNYHYTAALVDSNGQKCRLHVYFDEQDNLLLPPELSLNIDGNFEIIEIDPDLRHAFYCFAIQQGSGLISKLRQGHKQAQADLQQTYSDNLSKLEQLSLGLQSNTKLYFELLTQHMSCLKSLSRLSYDNIKYLSELSLSKSIYVILGKMAFSTTCSEEIDLSLSESDSLLATESALELTRTPVVLKKTPAEKQLELIKPILNAKQNHERMLEENNLEQLIDTAYKYSCEIDDLLLFNEHKRFSLENLIQLQNFSYQAEEICSKLLRRALLEENYACASKLIKFLEPIRTELFINSIFKNKPQLTEFVLANSKIPLNTILLGSSKKTKHLPIQYCFDKQSASRSYVEMLAVLIKYGGSLMVPAKDQLPIALHIIKEINNPLIDALKQNYEKTLFNKDFYKELIQTLNQYLILHPRIDDGTKLVLENKISQCKNTLKSLSLGGTRRADHRLNDEIHKVLNIFNPDSISMLSNDPEISQVYKVLVDKVAEYNRELLRVNRNYAHKVKHHERIQTINLTKSIELIQKKLRLNNLEISKESILSNYRNILRKVELKIELVKIQRKLSIPRTRETKGLKKLVRERDRLVEEIHSILPETGFISDNDFFLTEVTDCLDQMQRSIEGIQNILHLSLGLLNVEISIDSQTTSEDALESEASSSEDTSDEVSHTSSEVFDNLDAETIAGAFVDRA